MIFYERGVSCYYVSFCFMIFNVCGKYCYIFQWLQIFAIELTINVNCELVEAVIKYSCINQPFL